MVDKLNELQHQLQAEKDPLERERLQLSINALTDAVKRGVREHNEGGSRQCTQAEKNQRR
nr:MAG TPA: hypothetical protein [Caudoviricetes sp.]